eukprot:TRINITY_DN9467_c0_g1_i1.p1 TRINITY_DN9467_c0_g1~~TRINITY_DN9467_c0_g1_i1.p1  ORF type:complete len:327 (-),score=48.93 TRINITY_DN9467_c0_g1_i1:19-915(-)
MAELTNVNKDKQKYIGLKGKPSDTDILIHMNGKKIMMTGNPDTLIQVVQIEDEEVINDLDDLGDAELPITERRVFWDKIQNRIDNYKMVELSAPRPDKKLLVLDIDYTFFDHRSTASNPLVLKRPFMNEMLTLVYPYYDIIIWSATNMKWIEIKMVQLQIVPSEQYQICSYFDSRAMITVNNKERGVFDVKALPVIWGKYPEFYRKENTIMFDDIKRNFAMNPENGLQIPPFKKAPLNGSSDTVLYTLTKYLLLIKDKEDISSLPHWRFERYVQKREHRLHQILPEDHVLLKEVRKKE